MILLNGQGQGGLYRVFEDWGVCLAALSSVQWKRNGEEHWACGLKRRTDARCKFAGPRGSHEELMIRKHGPRRRRLVVSLVERLKTEGL
jgi:hypothetical protein